MDWSRNTLGGADIVMPPESPGKFRKKTDASELVFPKEQSKSILVPSVRSTSGVQAALPNAKTIKFDDVITDYEHLEPPGTDAWNPLGNEVELWHRVRLFLALCAALKKIPIPLVEAKILDVGCGVGRSTRALLEFGAKPENVLGIDIRPSAIALAESVNPAVPMRVVKGFEDWPPAGTFDLCMQCTVFSSIRGIDLRMALAEMMEKMVAQGRYIFWWDLVVANNFAGGDPLDPRSLFKHSEIITCRRLSLYPPIAEAFRYKSRGMDPLTWILQRLVGYPSTHYAALLRKTK
jgi:SAM-dependent methyltransferase